MSNGFRCTWWLFVGYMALFVAANIALLVRPLDYVLFPLVVATWFVTFAVVGSFFVLGVIAMDRGIGYAKALYASLDHEKRWSHRLWMVGGSFVAVFFAVPAIVGLYRLITEAGVNILPRLAFLAICGTLCYFSLAWLAIPRTVRQKR